MADSIKLFQLFQKIQQSIGIDPAPTNQKAHISTISIRGIFVICDAQWMFSMTAFFVIAANSMFEYGLSFLWIITAWTYLVIYLILTQQSQNTLKFIENCERFIEKSKY